MEFLAEDNAAGQTLLRLVARGSSIIAELLRLSDHIPAVFLDAPPPPEPVGKKAKKKKAQSGPVDPAAAADAAERARYAPILIDFRYLKNPDHYDEMIDRDADVVEMDEEFRDNHLELLERFYMLFESMYRYAQDFLTYLEEMSEGVFVQHTVEGTLMDPEGKQLLAEALYLYGSMMLLMDLRIPGVTRERMIVSYYRYKGAATVQGVDKVARLCRATGFTPGGARPERYPELMFERYKVPRHVVEMVIGRLRSDDIYNRNSAYPNPAHRSTALATQSSMLYVILYFAPHILAGKAAVMREVVDKHFNDNWVVPFYMGFKVDLCTAWRPYAAASKALANIVERDNVLEVTQHHKEELARCLRDLDRYLTDGVLVEEFVLDNLRKLMNLARSCNVTLRWFLLHRTAHVKAFREHVAKAADPDRLLRLMMHTAQFEFVIKEMFAELLSGKEAAWEGAKREAAERMQELSEYFSGEKALTRVERNEKLQEWFRSLADEIGRLDFGNATMAGRKIQTLMNALEDVQEFHQIESSLQVKSFLNDTRQYLSKMIRTANIREKTLGDLDIISDISYAWEVVGHYTPVAHEHIRRKPSIVLLLRATFLKLSSILSLPLVRITQCDSPDAVSVAEYYSATLVAYVRRVLDVVPESVFGTLDEITRIATNEMRPLPTKLERGHLKDFAQLPQRMALARATHQVSVFTQGVLAMKTTLVGIVNVDPKQVLEDGIRKKLVALVCAAFDRRLVFPDGTLADFEARLRDLGRVLDGLRSSFEYIQDYINAYGLKIWQEELSRIVCYHVEQESNLFLKHKVYDWQSTYQSDAIPIPRYAPVACHGEPADRPASRNFMGRLVREVLRQTDPARTVYVGSNQGWYSSSGREVVGIRTFDLINRGVGVFGLTGMDRLLCFMNVRDLRNFLRMYRREVQQRPAVQQLVARVKGALNPTTQFPVDSIRLYQSALQGAAPLWPWFLDLVTRLGQQQLLRRQIANELNFTCKMDSKTLSCALDVMNRALTMDVRAHYARPDSRPYPSNEALTDLTQYLDAAGFSDPVTKIYVTSDMLEGVPVLTFLFVVAMMPGLVYSRKLGTLISTGAAEEAAALATGKAASKKQRARRARLDGAPLVVGVITLLKQFHANYTHQFLAYLGQYVRASVNAHATKGSASALPPQVVKILLFLEDFCRFSSMSRSAVEAHIPSYIFDRFAR